MQEDDNRGILVIKANGTVQGNKTKTYDKYNDTCIYGIYNRNRILDTRVKEHIAAVKKGETATSAVAEHVWEEHHQMDFNNVAILAREANKDQRCSLE